MTHLFTALLLICLSATVLADDCVSNTQAFINNTEFVSAYEAMAAAVQADFVVSFDNFCTLNEGSLACQVNLAAYSSDVEQVCTAQNGTIVTRDVELTCSGQIQGAQIPSFLFNMFRLPICVDETCDADNLPSEIDVLFNEVVDEFVTEIESSVGDGLECEAETMGGSGGDPTSDAAALPLSIAAVSFMAAVAAMLM